MLRKNGVLTFKVGGFEGRGGQGSGDQSHDPRAGSHDPDTIAFTTLHDIEACST